MRRHGVSRKLWRVGWLVRVLGKWGLPGTVIRYGGGIGDDLLCSTVCHELRRRGVGRIWMTTGYPDLFTHNPDVAAAVDMDPTYLTLARHARARVCTLESTRRDLATDTDSPPDRHILAIMCRQAGVTGSIDARPYLYLTGEERERGRSPAETVVLQSSGQAARGWMRNKEWYPERFGEIAEVLGKRFNLVQIGSAGDPVIPGTRDLRGKTSLRETAALLHGARLFVGLVGFPMHLARAVDCPAVIVYGGRELPWQSGYSANENVSHLPPCAPCWKCNTCDRDRECMSGISAKQVLAAIERQLARPRSQTLPVEQVEAG